jgi:hypothetical protein
MKIVKFDDGTYGIRRRAWWSLFQIYEYRDLKYNDAIWWTRRDKWILDCKGPPQKVKSIFDRLKDKGTPVKLSEMENL